MALSVRKKRYLARLAGYAVNPVARRSRRALGREQTLVIGDHTLVLPPEHDLPFYQRRDPTYDAYAIEVLAGIAGAAGRTLVVDLGANVGDTALAALAASPLIDVTAVEGDPRFVTYLRRNLATSAPGPPSWTASWDPWGARRPSPATGRPAGSRAARRRSRTA